MHKMLQSSMLALQDREKKLAEAYDKIEKDLILLGATAVEDRLVYEGFLFVCLILGGVMRRGRGTYTLYQI